MYQLLDNTRRMIVQPQSPRSQRLAMKSWATVSLLAILVQFTCINARVMAQAVKEPSATTVIIDPAAKKHGDDKREESVPPEPPPPLTEYFGREIAPTMSFQGAGWLTRAERQDEEDCRRMLQELQLKEGMTVCDMGCGNGFYSLRMARKVSPNGKILAIDIQPEMLRMLQARAAEARLKNIELIQGAIHDPKLPVGQVDLILCVDVYHEFSHPEHMLQAMRRALKDDGVLVLLEYREEDPEVPIRPLHKMSKTQVRRELEPNGFRLVREFDELPWQHMMFFGRDPEFKEPTP